MSPFNRFPSRDLAQWALLALWTATLLMALVNALAVVRRMPIQRIQQDNLEEQAVRSAARWLQSVPPGAHVVMLLTNRDLTSGWFSLRLNYFVTPRRLDIAWESLPADAMKHYDFVLAYYSAQPLVS